MERDLRAYLLMEEWAKREFVVPGVDFRIIRVGESETSDFRRLYFKIRYADGEINEGTIFEARWEKSTGRVIYSEFQSQGMSP